MFSAAYHLQTNRKDKVVNCIIVWGLKTKIEGSNGNWVSELPKVH